MKKTSVHPWFPVFLAIAILALILLSVGFSQQYKLALGQSVYAAVNLLVHGNELKPDDIEHRSELMIAGQILGFIAIYGFILHIAWIFLGEGLRNIWIQWFYKNHIIVCDLNPQGQAFISNLRNSPTKEKIVVLLENVENEHESFCTQHNAKLIQGNPRLVNKLHAVAVQRAKVLIVCSDSYDTNLQIAQAAEKNLYKRSKSVRPLNLYLSLSDSLVIDGIGNENYSHFLQPGEKLNPYVYSAENLIARHYFNQYPSHTWADWQGQKQVHLVFAGFGALVESLICQYAQISPYKDFLPPVFTLVDPEAKKKCALLISRYPALENGRENEHQMIGGLHAIECHQSFKLSDAQLHEVATVDGVTIPPTAVLFATPDNALNFQHAVSLHQQTLRFNRWRVPFYSFLCQDIGIQALLSSAKSKHPGDQLIPFGMAEQVFDLDTLNEVELNACLVHEAYKKDQIEKGNNKVPSWALLPETYRAANRRAGDHIAVKLASLGCHIEAGKPLVLDDASIFDIAEERCADLSKLEHRSWRYERLLNGWRFGTERNDRRRIHPSISLWEGLSEEEQQKDVNQIKNVREALKLSQKDHIESDTGCCGQNNQHTPKQKIPLTVRKEVVIGLIGHNHLTVNEVAIVKEKLKHEIHYIKKTYSHYFITLITPLAPGSDFLLAHNLLENLKKEKDLPHRLLIIQAITLDKVVSDYETSKNDKIEDDKEWGKKLKDFIEESEQCESIIDLTLEGDTHEENINSYQRAADWIVERADELISVHDPSRGKGGKAGTSDTLHKWKQKNSNVESRVIDIS